MQKMFSVACSQLGSGLLHSDRIAFPLILLDIFLPQPAKLYPVCFNSLPETHNGYVQFLALQGQRLVPD